MIRRDGTMLAVAASYALLLTALVTVAATAAEPAPRLTREELVRQWDLNSDGKIDPGEAEIASSRMRRQRAEMRLQGGMDPLTGLPREAKQDGDEEPADAEEKKPAKPITAEDLYGTAEQPKADGTADATQGSRGAATGAAPKAAGPPRFGLPRNAGRQDARFAPLTGGVRAGAPAARPGYGSKLPAAPLNAGRPLDSIAPPSGMSGSPGSTQPFPPQAGTSVRGGLLPTPRPAPAPQPVRRSKDPYDPY